MRYVPAAIAMIRARRAVPAAGLAAIAVIGAAADAGGAKGGSMAPREALVTASALTARATVGSYCVTESGEPVAGMCADAAYPLETRGRLPVRPRDRVTLRFPDNPRIEDDVLSARVSLVRRRGDRFHDLAGDARAGRADGGSDRFRFRLPRRLEQANVLDIFVRYRGGGDASFWAGLRADPRKGTGEDRELCPSERQAEDRFDARTLVGKRLERARKVARRHGCSVRVVKRDGRLLAITDDLRRDRVNVVVRGQRVKRVRGVF